MYTVAFVGLNYFNACKEGQKEALIPNGTKGSAGDHIPQHNASVFIETDQIDSHTWWKDQVFSHPVPLAVNLDESRTVEMMEFRIPKEVEIKFRCEEGTLENVNLDQGLPKLQDVKGFVLDDHPDAIAKVPLPAGELEVFQFGSAALVRWLISQHKEPITITAFAGNEKRRVTLKKSDEQIPTEIVFSNTVDLLKLGDSHDDNGRGSVGHGGDMHMGDMQMGDMPAANAHNGEMDSGGNGGGVHDGAMGAMHGGGHGFAGHFVLYAKLDKERNESLFEKPVLPNFTDLAPLPFSHPYLTFLSEMDEVPDGACVPSCCG